MTMMCEFRWADENGAHNMPHPEELEYLGYRRLKVSPRFPSSWLMVRYEGCEEGEPDPNCDLKAHV